MQENINLQKSIDLESDKLFELFKQLPEQVQNAILNSGWEDKIRNLSKEYNLRVDQGTLIENMVFGLMVGVNESEDVYKTILEELKDTNKSNSLFKDIDEQIFSHIAKLIQAPSPREIKTEDNKSNITPPSPQFSAPVSKSVETPVVNYYEEKEDVVPSREDVMKDIEDGDDFVAPPPVVSPPVIPTSVAQAPVAQSTPTVGPVTSTNNQTMSAPSDFSGRFGSNTYVGQDEDAPYDLKGYQKPVVGYSEQSQAPNNLPTNNYSSASNTANIAPTMDNNLNSMVPPPPPPPPPISPVIEQKRQNIGQVNNPRPQSIGSMPDPVSVGLGNDISTGNIVNPQGQYNRTGADPYREPIN